MRGQGYSVRLWLLMILLAVLGDAFCPCALSKRPSLFFSMQSTKVATPRPISHPKLIVREEKRVPSTMKEALSTFFLGAESGPRLCSIAWLTALVCRLSFTFGPTDIILGFCVVSFWWIQEHALHKHLLHSPSDWYGKNIHESHHERPYFHISIDPGKPTGVLCAVQRLATEKCRSFASSNPALTIG